MILLEHALADPHRGATVGRLLVEPRSNPADTEVNHHPGGSQLLYWILTLGWQMLLESLDSALLARGGGGLQEP